MVRVGTREEPKNMALLDAVAPCLEVPRRRWDLGLGKSECFQKLTPTRCAPSFSPDWSSTPKTDRTVPEYVEPQPHPREANPCRACVRSSARWSRASSGASARESPRLHPSPEKFLPECMASGRGSKLGGKKRWVIRAPLDPHASLGVVEVPHSD